MIFYKINHLLLYQGFASITATPNNIVVRDSNANFATNSVVQNINTTTSATSTTTLTAGSAPIQVLIGTQTQIFYLPDATTLITNQQYQFINNSTSHLQVNSHSGASLVAIQAGTSITVYCTNNSTSDGVWVTTQVASNGASTAVARAVVTTQQNIPNTISTLIGITGMVDPNGWINSSTNQFKPNIAGYYQVYGATGYNSVATGAGSIQLILLKNGNPYSFGINGGSNGITNPQPQVTDIVYLNGTTDYLTFNASQNITTTATLVALLGSYFTFSLISN